MRKTLTLGSLFSGSGGFELAGYLCGVKPVWASEIEPFAIRITTKRFPDMKHLGDIRAINGAKIPPVDIISMGSPCTNLSLAGKREGLTGKESSLFFEAIRIIKEMRKETENEKPRYIIWENVAGAFSSNKGEDFRRVLSEIIQIAEPGAEVPACDAKGWPYADTILGAGWSVAYRTVDAQHFSVPQRRKRIYLVADFGSERAGDLLFERAGVCRDFAQGFRTWEDTARAPADSPGNAVAFEPGAASRLGGHVWDGEPVGALRAAMGDNQTAAAIPINTQIASRYNNPDNGGIGVGEAGDPSYTLQAAHSHAVAVDNHPADSRITLREDGVVQTLSARMGMGGGNVPLVQEPRVYGICSEGSNAMKSPNPHSGIYEETTSRTVDTGGGCRGNGAQVVVAPTYAMTAGAYTQVCEEQSPTLQARDWKDPSLLNQGYIVRRLTPTECAALQGFPRWWCAGLETLKPTEADITFWTEVWETHRQAVGKSKKPKSRNQLVKWLRCPHSDAAEYKLWGNGIALPCALFVLQGITEAERGE